MNRLIDFLAGGGAAAAILGWMGQALILGTLLAGLTWMIVRLLRRRIPPAVETALWLIVLVKFLTPIGPASPFSMAGLIERVTAYSSSAALTVAPFDIEPILGDLESPAAMTSASATPASDRSISWMTIFVVLYLAGVVVFLAYRVHTYRAMRSACRGLPVADESVSSLVDSVCRRLGVLRVPAVRLSDDAAAPFVIGLFKPLLVLSRRHLASPDELETVVVHEVAHLRRGDMFVRFLQWTAGSVLFFWPVVAWVNRRIDMAREHACDQWALRRGKLSAGEYARCLLEAVRPMPVRRFA